MLRYYEGTLFNVRSEALVNAVNCHGVMGSGLALEFMLRYPDMYDDYRSKCETRDIRPGRVDYYRYDPKTMIVNFPTKNHYRHPSRLSWIEEGLRHFVETYRQYGISSVAFPKLGTGHGGLEWEQVRPIMEKWLSNLDIQVYICLDDMVEAVGVEKEMLDRFNALSATELMATFRLSENRAKDITKNMPFTRFWHINQVDSVSPKTYQVLFRYFYESVCNATSLDIQTSLFD